MEDQSDARETRALPQMTHLYCPICGHVETAIKKLYDKHPENPQCPVHSKALLPMSQYTE